MSRFKHFIKVLGMSAAMIVAPVHAGGGGAMGGGASEWTQLLNNIELVTTASESAQTAAATTNQYITQLDQYRVQLKNASKAVNLPLGVSESLAAYDKYVEFKNSLTKVSGSLQAESTAIQTRFDEARLMKMGWPAYVQYQKDQATKKNKEALARISQEGAIMKQVDDDYSQLRSLQDQIPQTDGMHAALQLMNTQMNKLLVQNVQMMQLLASTNVRDGARKMAVEAEGEQNRADRAAYLRRQQIDIENNQMEFSRKLNTLPRN